MLKPIWQPPFIQIYLYHYSVVFQLGIFCKPTCAMMQGIESGHKRELVAP